MKKKETDVLNASDHISVHEAAELLDVAYNTALSYVNAGRLKSIRIAGVHVIPRSEIEHFKRGMAGRPRTSVPKWRFSPEGNEQIGTSVEADLLEGITEKAFLQALEKVKSSGEYLFEGTIARYVFSDRETPRRVQFLLIWRATVMPPDDEIERALAALRVPLAHVLAWETARNSTQRIWMHT